MATSTAGFSNPLQSASTSVTKDVYGAAFDSTEDIYSAVLKMTNTGEDGKVTLPDGTELDMNTLTGLTTFSVYLQFLQAYKEIIDNVFVFVKNLENKLENMLSS